MYFENISPIRLHGAWNCGYALDRYVVHSIPLGENDYGYMQFNNTYSVIGSCLNRMKYNGKIDTSQDLLNLSIPFLDEWFKRVTVDTVIPVPPSNYRKIQPVFLYGKAIASHYKLRYLENALVKTSSAQAKNNSRSVIGKIRFKTAIDESCNVLLIDDLFNTGITANECVRVLRSNPNIHSVFLLTIAKNKNSR